MPQTGYCTDVTCTNELTELYECHCCSWLICLKHLVEHVEVYKREKQHQLDVLRNELSSISFTLETIVDNKVQEIQCEKLLISRAKTMLDKSGSTIEEVQSISEEINLAIVSNRKEEIVVKVEPFVSDIKPYSCTDEIITNTMMLTSLRTSGLTNPTLDEPQSSAYISLRTLTNAAGSSSTPQDNDPSNKVNDAFNISNTDGENVDPDKDKDDDKEHNQRTITNRNKIPRRCPLTFDGAFGLTKENHSLELCPIDTPFRSNLINHLVRKHKIRKTDAHRIYFAAKNGKNPRTTNLFRKDGNVLDHNRRIPCPFSNRMINLIGCCPTNSRRIPCLKKLILIPQLVRHLRKRHNLTLTVAREVTDSYIEKLSEIISTNGDDILSY